MKKKRIGRIKETIMAKMKNINKKSKNKIVNLWP